MKEKEFIRPFWKYPFILLITFFITTIALNSIFRLNFYNQSLNFIISLQMYSNIFLDVFMNLISLLANTHFILALLVIVYTFFKRKLAVLVYISYFLLNAYMVNILKIGYQEPRPFWTASEIKKLEWGCPSKYGNPSGHSWMVILIYQPLVTDFLIAGSKASYKMIWYIFVILIGVLVPFSRMYLGSHTGNQIMMGLTIGLIMNALYRLKIQELIYQFYLDLYHKISMYTRIQLTIVNLFVLTVPLLIYSINSISPTITHYPYIHNLNTKCLTNQHTGLLIQQASLKAHAIINLAFGIIFGLASSAKISYLYFLGRWNYRANSESCLVSKFVLKIILEVMIAMPSVVLFAVIVPKFVDNAYIKYLSSCLGYWMCGFILVKYGDIVLRACNVTEYQGRDTTTIIIKQRNNSEEVNENYR